jgi:hypothetical protein
MRVITHIKRSLIQSAAQRLFNSIEDEEKIAPRLCSPLRVERAGTHVHGQDAHAT